MADSKEYSSFSDSRRSNFLATRICFTLRPESLAVKISLRNQITLREVKSSASASAQNLESPTIDEKSPKLLTVLKAKSS